MLQKYRYAAIGTLALVFLLQASGAPAPQPETVPNPVILVELFTSEGCSSCPSADALLARIHEKATASGQIVIGISEHVTYWNHQGWTDPYSADTYTDRQYSYGRRFNLGSVYTPQMVVNGSEEFVGSISKDLQDALQKEDKPAAATLHILSTVMQGGFLAIHFTVEGSLPKHGVELMAVLTDDTGSSNVLRGENRGHELSYVSIARLLTRIATVHGATDQTVKLPIPSALQGNNAHGHHLILFAQEPGFGAVLSTDIKPL